jgi:hypothetical protein
LSGSEQRETYGYELAAFDRAVCRAWVDDDFRVLMLSDARSAFEQEGVVFPQGVRVTVHEFSPNDRHYFLPPKGETPKESTKPAERPPGAPDDHPAPVGGIHHAIARPFMLGHRGDGHPNWGDIDG